MKHDDPQRRSRELAKIHVAKKQLGLDDGAYRDLLWTVARVRSAGDLDAQGRARLLEHFAACGFKGRRRRDPGVGRLAAGDLIAKIEAQLTSMGLEWAYADAIAKRMHGVESVRWCKPDQLSKIVAALAYEQEKRGLLSLIDRKLAELGRARDYVDTLVAGRVAGKSWTRSLPWLKRIAEHLVSQVEQRQQTEEAP